MKKPNQPSGKYYVTDACTECGQCSDIAPNVFRDGAVIAQPANIEDDGRIQQINCPAGAILSDGDHQPTEPPTEN